MKVTSRLASVTGSPYFATLALPVVFLLAGVYTVLTSPPSWFTYADPAYQYLLNGPSIIFGSGTGHADHPGTSMQVLTGIFSIIFHLVSRDETPLVAHLVSNPEGFASFSIVIFVLIQALVLWFTGSRLARHLGTGAAVLFQSAILATTALTFFRAKLIPESLVILCAILLIGLLSPNLVERDQQVALRRSLAIGLVSGIGVMAKVIFIPLLLLPFILLKFRALLPVALAFIATVGVFLFIARDQISYMIDWFTAVSSTNARYPDETQPENWYSNLQNLPSALTDLYPVWVFSLLVMVIAIIFLRPRIPLRLILAFIIPSVFTFFMMYKSFRVNDLLVLAPLSGLALAGTWYYLIPRLGGKLSWIRLGIPFISSILSIYLIANSSITTAAAGDGHDDAGIRTEKLSTAAASGTRVAVGYGVFTKEAALYYANLTSRNFALSEMVRQYPNWIDFNIWNSMFYGFNSESRYLMPCEELATIVDSPAGLLWVPGRELTPQMPNEQYLLVQYSPVGEAGQFTIYRINKVICR